MELERIKDFDVCVWERIIVKIERELPRENVPKTPKSPSFFFWNLERERPHYIYIYIYILWLEFTGARIVCASNAGHTLCAPVHWSSWLISFQIWTTIWKRSRNLIDLILVELERYGCLISRSSKFSKIGWRTKELWTIEASWHAW